MQNKNPTRFYCKYKTRIEQGETKKKYPKLVLNKLKVIKCPTFIYNVWGPNSRKFSWKLCPHVWPMTTHVWPMIGLRLN